MSKINRRNLFAVLLVVLTWLGFVISGSHALLGDSAILTGNTISVGSVGLLINNSQDPDTGSFAHSMNGFAINLVPGQSVDHYFTLKNTSSAGVPLDIDMTVSSTDDIASNLGTMVTLEVVPVDDQGNPLPDAPSTAGTLSALKTTHMGLDDVIPENSAQRYRLRTMLAKDDTVPDQTVAYDLIFTGTQKVL